MARAASHAAVASHRGNARASRRSAVDAATAAWLCALPVAALVAVSILLLGPPLGGLLNLHASFTFLPQAIVYDESTEQARYLIALLGPVLLALATWLAVKRGVTLSPGAIDLGPAIAQLALVGLLVVSVVVQHRIRYATVYTGIPFPIGEPYFTLTTLAAAAAFAAVLLLASRSAGVRRRFAAFVRESPARRWGALATAALATVLWLLHAVNSEESIASVLEPVRYHLEFPLDEAFAVLNGLTPLVDFNPQYSALWPFASALAMHVAGESVLVFTLAMCALTSIALMAIYGVLRRATGSSMIALLLYVPFVATSMFAISGATANRATFGNYFGIFPLRYAGPYLLAWLTARRLERGGGSAGLWLLFTAAGLVLINNPDFGLVALVACAAALVWGGDERRRLRALAVSAVAGLATAAALVSLLTLARTGSLPQPRRLIEYSRLYSVGGYATVPMPTLGLHVAIYLTYAGALGVATVRALRGARNTVLTGMLAWIAVFGLGAASYYVGRSHPETLRTTFSAWALALALLAFVALRALAARPRWPLAIACTLFGFGLVVTSISQFPTPWSQLRRIEAGFVRGPESLDPHPLLPPADARTRAFVSSLADGRSRFRTRPGAPVAVLNNTGHRVAHAYGIVDVSPFTGVDSIHTVEQVRGLIAVLRDAGGNTMIVPTRTDPGMLEVLRREGFELVTPRGLRPYDPASGLDDATSVRWYPEAVVKLVDTRNLHPRALE